jgi:hypothetical protein
MGLTIFHVIFMDILHIQYEHGEYLEYYVEYMLWVTQTTVVDLR